MNQFSLKPNLRHRSGNSRILFSTSRRAIASCLGHAGKFAVAVHLDTRPRDEPGAARALFGDANSGCSNKAAGFTSSEVASTRSASKVGFAAPVSRRDMYVRKKPVLSANSSCVMPRATRSSLMRKPRAIRGASFFTPRCCLSYTNSYTHLSGHLMCMSRPVTAVRVGPLGSVCPSREGRTCPFLGCAR